jgi:hypothetical protein
MKELPTHTQASAVLPRRRSSAWTVARRFAALALLGVIGFHSSTTTTTTSESVLDRVYDAVHELKWKSTVLSKDPHERALQLMDRQPVIGQFFAILV